ncbi:MAG: repeat-containing protein [Verrucomicrobiaceae bacterium]|nr:repeat-containing protein [Verrucomicrobiaceae bacterium]
MTHRPVSCHFRSLVHCGLAAGVLGCVPGLMATSLSDWSTLVSFRPDPALQSKLQSKPAEADAGNWSIQKIERSRGELLLESTSLVVTKMPAFGGKVVDSRGLLREVRQHLAEFFDPAQATFAAASPEDQAALNAPNPAGAIVHVAGKNKDAAYLLGEATPDHVVWTSLHGAKLGMGINPFSGNRELGVNSALPLDGCVLYSRAALRATEAATPEEEKALAAQSLALWQGVFQNIRAFVEKNGGAVVDGLEPPVSTLVAWNDVAKTFHQPKIPWQDMDGLWQSTDKEKRFAIQFRGLSAPCEFIERNRKGKELRVPVPIQVVPGAKGVTTYVLERPNDSKDVLSFYEFNPTLQNDIINSMPKPSKLVLTRLGDKLKGEWYGLTISRDAAGRLATTKQPGVVKARLYEFKPEGL